MPFLHSRDTLFRVVMQSGKRVEHGWLCIGGKEHHPLFQKDPLVFQILQHFSKEKEDVVFHGDQCTATASNLHSITKIQFETSERIRVYRMQYNIHRVLLGRSNCHCVLLCNTWECLVFLQTPFDDDPWDPNDQKLLIGDLTAACTLYAKQEINLSIIFTREISETNQKLSPSTKQILVDFYKEVERRVHYFLTKPNKTKKYCAVCYNYARRKCPCKTTRYCGALCQKIDWKDHMHTCPLRCVD